jgi:hypothetical protein
VLCTQSSACFRVIADFEAGQAFEEYAKEIILSFGSAVSDFICKHLPLSVAGIFLI